MMAMSIWRRRQRGYNNQPQDRVGGGDSGDDNKEPNRQRIAGPSRKSRRESLDVSAEEEDRQRRRDVNRRTRRRRCQHRSAGYEGNALPTTTTAQEKRQGWAGADDKGNQGEQADDDSK